MLLVLFGLSGAGKNFVGDILAKEFRFHYWDADPCLPADMRAKVLQKEPFTQSMRDSFTQIIIDKIFELKKNHPKLVVSQALYKEKNRAAVKLVHPEAKMVYIHAENHLILERIKQRPAGIGETYAKKISLNFDPPPQPDAIIYNNSDAQNVIKQLQLFIPQT